MLYDSLSAPSSDTSQCLPMRNQKTRWPQETVYLLDGEEQGNKQKLKELGKRVVGVSPSLVPLAPDNDRCQL